MHRTCKNTSVKPDRHCENGSILWRDWKNHQNDVTTCFATASRCVTTVPFSWRDGQNHQMMWPPAMQQHPGASIRFLVLGETDRITKWCDHQLCNSIQVAGGHIIWWFCPSRQEKGTVVTHLDAVANSWWSHHLVILSVSPRTRNRIDAPGCCCIAGGHWWSHHLVILSVSPRTRNRSDAPGCCCIAGGHIIWWFCPSRQEQGTVLTHLDAVACVTMVPFSCRDGQNHQVEVLYLFRCSTHTQTHPPSPLHHSYTSSSLLAFLCSV